MHTLNKLTKGLLWCVYLYSGLGFDHVIFFYGNRAYDYAELSCNYRYVHRRQGMESAENRCIIGSSEGQYEVQLHCLTEQCNPNMSQ